MTKSFPSNHSCSVLVLGSHRSGTSVLTRALASLGVNLGEDLYGPRYDNPKGFFEDKIANQLDEKILKLCHCWWGSLILPPDIPPDVVDYYQRELKEKIFKRFEENTLWGLKDPRISRLWRLWIPVFEESGVKPAFMLANRHPYSVASSLAKRDQMSRAHALALWVVHQIDALDALVEHGGLVVDYDLMMKTPRQELRRIACFLGTADRLDQEEITRFERDFLSQELRHSKFFNESAASPLQSLCLCLYTGLLELAQLSGCMAEEHINQARNLAKKCRDELARSIEWMQAIDDLHALRCKVSSCSATDLVHQLCEARLYLSEIIGGIPQSYTESRVSVTLYPISKQRQTIRLPLPIDFAPLSRIRLDLANCPVAIWIHGLALKLSDNSDLWCWRGDTRAFVNAFGLVVRPDADGLLLLCLNDDPQFDLDLPSDVLASMPANACLVVEFTPHPLTDVISEVLRKNDRLIADLRADLSKRESLKNHSLSAVSDDSTLHLANDIEMISSMLKNTLDRRDQTIARQAMQLKQMREQLLRAEAQLDLLKDVMLGGPDDQL